MNTARYVVLENATVCHVARTLSCVLTHSSGINKCTVHDMPRARPPERARAQTVGPNERSRVACRRRCVQHKLAEPEGSSSHPRSSARVPARAPARRARARGDDPAVGVPCCNWPQQGLALPCHRAPKSKSYHTYHKLQGVIGSSTRPRNPESHTRMCTHRTRLTRHTAQIAHSIEFSRPSPNVRKPTATLSSRRRRTRRGGPAAAASAPRACACG